MSAIGGVVCFHGAPAPRRVIDALTRSMERRGPDGRSHWVDGSVALGHCMLKATPEAAAERQPLKSRDGSLVLAWDGRLDNRAELRRSLAARGATIRTHTDAELVLQCYAVWGAGCPEHLLGDFAFAVWDSNQRRLLCATDHMGARPLYWHRSRDVFAFASEDEALLAVPGVSNRTNDERIASYLLPAFRSFSGSSGLLSDIAPFGPATAMQVSTDGRTETSSYWTPEPGPETVYDSDAECMEAFTEVFGEAVRCRMRAPGDIAAMVSGGLDSAALATMVRRLMPETPGKSFHTYSAISDDPEACIESRCIESVTRHAASTAHFLSVPSFTGMAGVEDLVEAAWSRPHPASNSLLLPALMCRSASRDGHRVLMHGCNGDLAMHSPRAYIAPLLRQRRWQAAWRETRCASRRHTLLRGAPAGRILLDNLRAAFVPDRLRALRRWLKGSSRRALHANSLISDELVRRLDLVRRLQDQPAYLTRTSEEIQIEHIHALRSPYGIANGLRGYERVAGRCGLEVRDPWSDKRVVEFFLRLPLRFKVRDGWTKHLARTSFTAELDPIVRRRTGREHLGPVFIERLLDESCQLIEELRHRRSRRCEAYADPAKVSALFSQCRDPGPNADVVRQSKPSLINDLYAIIVLELWLTRIDQQACSSPLAGVSNDQ